MRAFAQTSLNARLPTLPDELPNAVRFVCALSLSAVCGYLAQLSRVPESDLFPAPLLLSALVGPFAALLVGRAFSVLAFFAALAIVIGFGVGHPASDAAELARRANLLTSLVVTQLFVLGYGRTYRLLKARLDQQQQRIEERLAERARLTRALGVDLSRALTVQAAALSPRRPSVGVLVAAQAGLEEALLGAKRALSLQPSSDLPVSHVLPDFRRQMTRWLLAMSLLGAAVPLLRVSLTGTGPRTIAWLMFGLTLSIFVLSERYAQLRPVLVGLLTAVTWLAIVASCFYWGFEEPPPNLLFLATLTYNALLIRRRYAVTFVLAICLATEGWAAYEGAASSAHGASLMACLALWTLLLQVCWFLFERRVGATLRGVEQRAAELKQLDDLRARICGTLFHDVANPVQAIGMLVQRAQLSDAASEQDLSRLRGFHHRLSALVTTAFEVIEQNESAIRAHTAAASVSAMLSELGELFAHRLAEKQQTLRTDADPELSVLAVSELVRDSVLANLISNAIKFSPHGATIEVSGAARSAAEVEIVVRDQGPGFPRELLSRLEAGQRPHSTPGTTGELGMGLGLTLACEHVRRMGGQLSFSSSPQGGAQATVRLPRA